MNSACINTFIVSSDSTSNAIWIYNMNQWSDISVVGPSNRIRASVIELSDSVKIYGGITGTIYLPIFHYS